MLFSFQFDHVPKVVKRFRDPGKPLNVVVTLIVRIASFSTCPVRLSGQSVRAPP